MKINIKKRLAVRIISFSLAFILIFAGSIIYNTHKVGELKRVLTHKYQAAMESLSSEMDNISVTLGKTLYTKTPSTLTALTSQLVLQTGTAAAALNNLPVEHQSVKSVSKFLNQVSDYSLYLANNVVKGGEISDSERKNLIELSKIAKKLSSSFNDTKTMYNSAESWGADIENSLKGSDFLNNIESPLTETENALGDYPTLIYDGPFSDHILEKSPEMLKGAKEVTESAAKQTAAKYLRINAEDLTLAGEEKGKMPSYIFEFDDGVISVTKKGGYVCFFRKDREIKSVNTDYEGAVRSAEQYIKSLGVGSFETSYYFADEGMCVVNFAFLQGDTICYPDLIKIGVALDNYEVLFYESSGFIANHKARTLKVPTHTAEEASKIISPHLKIENTHLAIIPSGGQKELYCYEFLCTGEENEEILVYVNTETLYEEQIFILLKTDGGTLTK
ncbi:MAG: germination protein YpeB [Clostridia bacterium]|nr:germination protein YpeB [Clostridia bacterium]